MVSQKSPIPSPLLPYPPIPIFWPWRSPVLGHIKFASPMGLSFQWWLTRPSFDTYAARDTSSGSYWLVHIIVPPIGLQTPSAPWVLSLASPLGALCSILQMTVSIHFCICQALTEPLKRPLYQAPVSKVLLTSAIVSGFGGCLWNGSPGGAVSR